MPISKEELEDDIKELRHFQASVSRTRTIKLLEEELARCERLFECISLLDEDSSRLGTKKNPQSALQQDTKVSLAALSISNELHLKELANNESSTSSDVHSTKALQKTTNSGPSTNSFIGRTETIRDYGWHQTPKFVKLYVRVAGVRKNNKVASSFTGNTFTLSVSEVNNKNYSLVINNLARPIIAHKSCHETRTDEVMVKLFKAEANEQWLAVTAVEAAMLQKETAHKVVATKNKPDNSAKSTNDVDQDISPVDDALLTKILFENARWTSMTGTLVAKKNEHRLSRTVAASCAHAVDCNRALVVLDHETAMKAIEIIETRPFEISVFIRTPEFAVPEQYVGMIEVLILHLTTLQSFLQLRCLDSFWMRGCAEKLIRDETTWIHALFRSTKRDVCKLVEMLVNLEAATIRKLPPMVSIGLAVAHRDQYDAIQEIEVLRKFELSIARNLDVSGYPPLKPWTERVILHFYGLRDCDLDWMIRTVRTLTNDRLCHIVLPGSELTVYSCIHLASRMSAINVPTLLIDSPYIGDTDDQNRLRDRFVRNGTMVRWSLETIYYWYEALLDQD